MAQIDNEARQWHSLTEPILLDRLIGYRGFKALAFVGGSADRLFAMDTDLARPYWTTHLTYAVATGGQPPSSWECPGGFIATPSRRVALAPSAFASGGGGGGGSAKSAVGEPGKGAAILSERPAAATTPAAPRDVAPPPAPTSAVLAPVPFGGVDPLYVMGSDGLLRTLRVSDGTMTAPMVPFLPPNARPSSLTFINGVVYTSTSHGLRRRAQRRLGARSDGRQQGDDLAYRRRTRRGRSRPDLRHRWHAVRRDDQGHLAGTRTATQAASSRSTARRLQPKDWFTADAADFNASPVVFKHKDRKLVAASGNDGRLYLLDAASLGGADHQTPLHVTPKYSAPGTGGGLATWEDADTRWIVASVDGGPTAGLTFASNGLAPAGSVVAFKLVDADGKIDARAVLAIAGSGFAAGATGGERDGLCRVERRVPLGSRRRSPPRSDDSDSAPARLYVLDAVSGKPLWNSGLSITSSARARLAAGSGQVYLVTADNHLYAFGIPMEH